MRLALLGDPVEHSRSPAIHTAALRAVGIEGTYEPRRVDAAGMAQAVAEIRSGVLHGANVTMPHKAPASSLADRATREVGRAGVANTLVADAGAVVAHNTDVFGLREARGDRRLPAEAPVLVLGAGGAAAAALIAWEGREIVLATRRPAAAEALVGRVGVSAAVVSWGRPVPGAVVVNATPLGMHGEELPSGLLDEASGLVDLAYGDGTTPAVYAARRLGIPVVDGIDHLVAQAARSFTIWTGLEAPMAAMAAAARSA